MKKTSKLTAAAALFFAAAGIFAEPTPGQKLFEKPGYAETRPEPSSRTELTAVFSGTEAELDFRKSYLASEAQIFTALYEGLFSYNPLTLEPVPAAASSWRLSEDKKVWTFTIRANAKYWNGDPLEAEDFRAAWLDTLDPAKNSPYSSLYDIISGAREFRLGLTRNPAEVGINAPDSRTLVVTLNAPASFFPSMLCHHSFSPVHPSMANIENWSAPVSNGPFFVSENGTGYLTLLKNRNYWDAGSVALEKITIRFVDDDDESTAMWNSGEARWLAGGVNLETLTDRSGIVVNPMFATHYYYIRSEGPFSDHRVRRALVLALPWDEIRENHFLPAKTLVYPIPGYPELKGVETNVEEAQDLLAEAGFPKGIGLPELVIRITPAEEADRIGKLMAAAWMGKLGIPVKLDVVPYSRYFAALKGKDYNVGSSTWIGDFADPYTFLQMWRKDSNLNDSGYNDGDFETLMEKSMTEEGDKRFEILGEAEQMLLDRGTVLPISYTPALNIVDTDELDGWFPNALDIHPFKYFSFKAFKPLPGVAVVRE
ncbi:MAG: peptide ABC transporter substrate-binding protein [Treponema sp.]|jgi:peptide/nickel transport system substrate-binding protein/oligopeptide transport system substrate-binding protein|nr:peptide ABC transporter substrate-binding protein [Treponema sp.]